MHTKGRWLCLLINALLYVGLFADSGVVQRRSASCNCTQWKHARKSAFKGKIGGFYNIYAGPNLFLSQEIVQEQVNQLRSSDIFRQIESVKYLVFGSNHAKFMMPDDSQGKFVSAGESKSVGDERDTLQLLYDHCIRNKEDRVIYIHSKGSFHPSKSNDVLRRNLMKAVNYCVRAGILDHGDICGLRFAPIPYPHISGFEAIFSNCHNLNLAKFAHAATICLLMNDSRIPAVADQPQSLQHLHLASPLQLRHFRPHKHRPLPQETCGKRAATTFPPWPRLPTSPASSAQPSACPAAHPG